MIWHCRVALPLFCLISVAFALRRELRESDVYAVTNNDTLARREKIADQLQAKLLGECQGINH